MKINLAKWFPIACLGVCVMTAQADERRFAFTYEPETMPKGGMEFEQWTTLATQRSKEVGQQNYNRWDIREALEYGVTDNYTVELYLNSKSESFRDPSSRLDSSKFSFEGISIENRFLLLNPARQPIGVTLYLEPRFSGEEAEVEEKIILGQRHGNWKWALNFTHATEWLENLRQTEGEVEASFGLARDFQKHWSLGVELRDHNEIPKYRKWENTALFIGPVLSYRNEKWWGALAVLPQIWGRNFGGDPDGHPNLDLEGHERMTIRLIFGIDF